MKNAKLIIKNPECPAKAAEAAAGTRLNADETRIKADKLA
jgi:hypothetical protein